MAIVHQLRPCLRAKVSAVKLWAIEPEEKDRELDVLHLEHVTYTPAPPDQKGRGQNDQSLLGYQKEGREDSLFEADRNRAVLLHVHSGMKGETVKWVAVHVGKGGNSEVGCSSWWKRGKQ